MLRVFGHCRRLSAKTPALMQLMELLVHSSSSIGTRIMYTLCPILTDEP